MNDAELLQAYLDQGSDGAFRELVQKHVGLVYATASRLVGDHAAAEDVAQAVFIALAVKAPLLRGRSELGGWLYKTTVHKAREHLRQGWRRAQREALASTLGSNMHDDTPGRSDLVEALDQAMLDLLEKERQALVLRFFQERSLREVGQALGIREDAAQKRVAAALDSLASAFRRRGYTVPAGAGLASLLAATTRAVPAGLAELAAQAALRHGASLASLGILGWLTAKALLMTKMQTAVLCGVLAAVPLVWEQQALNETRRHLQVLQAGELAISEQLARNDADLQLIQRRLHAAQERRSALELKLQRRLATTSASATADPYPWPPDLEYVRVPKSLLGQLALADEAALPKPTDPRFENPRTVLGPDGAVSPFLRETLALTEAEHEAMTAAVARFTRDFTSLTDAHSFATNTPPGIHAIPGDSRTRITEPFPGEGAALSQTLRAELEAALGHERAAIFWHQAQPDFLAHFNAFGAARRTETVVVDTRVLGHPALLITDVEDPGSAGDTPARSYRSDSYRLEQVPGEVLQWWTNTPAYLELERLKESQP